MGLLDLEIYDSGRKKALHCQVDYLSVYENRIVETSKTIYLRDPLWGKLDLNFLMDGEIRRNGKKFCISLICLSDGLDE